jgi:nitroimidazol reductase NimA-like FMN-containing flavoprotein (pyridoxamine 5'-phosphate oxidase superfamily)
MDTVAEGAGRKLVVLDRSECLRLLATVPVGRLIFTAGALPTVKMMNFVLAGDMIVLRTAPGTAAARKAAGSVVAFEADTVDAATSSGWSVTVTGWAELVTEEQAIATYSSLALVPWAPGERDQFITIRAEVVQGQHILPG